MGAVAASRDDLITRANFIYGKFSTVPEPSELEAAYEAGMLRREQLEDGVYYLGACRNGKVARWSRLLCMFTYMRYKFGNTFPENIPYPEDCEGFDLFVPVAECEPSADERIPS